MDTDNTSDASVRSVRDGIMDTIRQLQADSRDYGGHRGSAVSDLQRAEAELNRALAFEPNRPTDNSSDANLRRITDGLTEAENQLKADQRDYGGHRANAVADVQRAINELRLGLQYERTH